MSTAVITTDYQLLTALMNCINSIGADNTVSVLKQSINEKHIKDINFCVNTVLQRMTLSMEDVRRYNYDDNRKVAIGFCIYFLREIYEFSFDRLEAYLPFGLKVRSFTNYVNVIRKFQNQPGKRKSDVDILISEHFEYLKEIFVNHKKTFCTNEKDNRQRKAIS